VPERIDDLQLKGLKLIQNPKMFCFGTDSVLLADFVELRNGDNVVDLGTGNGIIPVLLSGRGKKIRITGIEIQPEAAELARRNMRLNGLEQTVEILTGDLKEVKTVFPGYATVVLCNPPYEKVGSGKISGAPEHRIARHEVMCTLEDVVKNAAELLQTGGRFFLIHRSERLAQAIYLLKKYALEPKVLRMIQAGAGKPPGYALIKSVRDAAEGLKVRAPLILYDERGRYTEELDRIYHREHV